MSLSTINHPVTLLATASAGIASALQLSSSSLSLSSIKSLHLASFFLINLVSVRWPGRLDGELERAILSEIESDKPPLAAASTLLASSGRTLVAPSPYAFAIWGPIYLLEAYAMIYIATLSPSSPLVSILQRTAPFWFLANVFQALWSCSFRKKFVTGSPLAKILSPLFLSLTSLSLSKIHAIATQSRATITRFEYATAFFGIALHFGWTAAASLVNINGSLAYALASLSLQKYAGFLSVLAATALALFVVAGGGGGIVPLVLAWALKAVGSGMTARLKIEKGNQVGAGAMKTLSEAGAGVCAALGVWGLTGGDGAGDFWGGKWGSGDLIF